MELKVIVNPIEGAGPAKRLLSNLFHGCGYSFYLSESRLRLDDLLVRVKLHQLVRESHAHLRLLEAAFRADHPRSNQDHPYPDPYDVAELQALQRAARELKAMETAIAGAEVPEFRPVDQRMSQDRGTLEQLVILDGETLLALVTLRDAVARFTDGTSAAAAMDDLLRASNFNALWSRRDALLTAESDTQ